MYIFFYLYVQTITHQCFCFPNSQWGATTHDKIPLGSAIYGVVIKNDLCTSGISAQHILLFESIHNCTTPNSSITLYYTHNRGHLASDCSLHKMSKDAEKYHIAIPEYRAPDILY